MPFRRTAMTSRSMAMSFRTRSMRFRQTWTAFHPVPICFQPTLMSVRSTAVTFRPCRCASDQQRYPSGRVDPLLSNPEGLPASLDAPPDNTDFVPVDHKVLPAGRHVPAALAGVAAVVTRAVRTKPNSSGVALRARYGRATVRVRVIGCVQTTRLLGCARRTP